MSILRRILGWSFTQSLKLYPANFRANFGDEMRTVFEQAIEGATQTGISKTLSCCLREMKDLPGSLLSQHWAEARPEASKMTQVSEVHPQDQNAPAAAQHQPGSWGQVFLGGLPHLLMGLLMGYGNLLTPPDYPASMTLSIIIGVCLTVLVLIVLLYAWRGGWPLWSASWYGYGAWVFVAVISIAIETLDLQGAWRYTNTLFLGWVAAWGIGYLYIIFHDHIKGLLMVFFFIPFLGVMMLEFVPDLIQGRLAIGFGLLSALAAGAIIRRPNFRLALGLVVGVNLAAALTLAYVGEYKILDLPAGIPTHSPKFTNYLELLSLYAIFALILMGTPFLIQGLVNIRRRKLSP